jgi:uncharacterized membrane protein (DUF4010 family)
MDPLASEVIEAAYAVGIGLAIGLEREHSDLTRESGDGEPADRPADTPEERTREVGLGARTFALLGLVGWALAVLGDANMLIQPIGMASVVALLGVQFVLAARKHDEIGATTEIAAIAVLVIGGLVHTDRRLAVVLGIVTALLLVSKPWMRGMVVRLRTVEVASTIQLAVLVAVLLPLLPEEPLDPWNAVPPRKVGMFVVLLAGVEYVGYVLTRVLGASRGAVLTGLVGGLTSSTAVTASMARSIKGGQAPRAAQITTLLANLVMCIRLAVITGLLAPALLGHLALPLGAMAAVLTATAVVTWVQIRREPTTVQRPELKNPFSLIPALTMGAILVTILFASKLATQYFGDNGFLIAAAASGLADVDAISLAAARAVKTGDLSLAIGALAVVIAAASNALTKSILSVSVGGRAYGRPIALALLGGSVLAVALALAGLAL